MRDSRVIRTRHIFIAASALAIEAALAGAVAAPLRPSLNFKGCTPASGAYECEYELVVHPVHGVYTGPFGVSFQFADSEILGFTSSDPNFVENATDGYCNAAEITLLNDPDTDPSDFAFVGMQKAGKVADMLCGDYYAPKTISISTANPYVAQLTLLLDANAWSGAAPPRACAVAYGAENTFLSADLYCTHNAPPTKQCIPSPSSKEVFRAAMDAHYGDILGAMPIRTLSWNNDPPRQVEPVAGHGGKSARLTKGAHLWYEPVSATVSPFAFGASPFSIDGWIKLKATNPTAEIPILDTRSKNPSAGGVYIYVKNNQIVAEILDSSGAQIAAPVQTNAPNGVADDVWRHFAVTVTRSSPAKVRMLLGGKPVDLQPIASPNAAVGGGKRMLLGRNGVTNDEGQALQIDDLTIHHRVLLLKEVDALAKSPRCKLD